MNIIQRQLAYEAIETLWAITCDSRHADGQPLMRYNDKLYEDAVSVLARWQQVMNNAVAPSSQDSETVSPGQGDNARE